MGAYRLAPHTKPKIQLCHRCGRMRVHHRRGYYECDVPDEVYQAVRLYADGFGKRWKSLIVKHWHKPHAAAELKRAMELIGPKRIHKIEV